MSDLGKLVEALAAAKGAIKVPKKGRTANVGKYSYSYADRADVIEAYGAALAANGLQLIHTITKDENGHMTLVSVLAHTSGEMIESCIPIPNTADAQALGSFLTYFERYNACALLDIAAQDDDDGQRAVQAQRKAAEAEEDGPPVELPFLDLRIALVDAAKELEQKGGGLWPELIRKASEFTGDKGKLMSFSDPMSKSVRSEKWVRGTLAKITAQLAAEEPGAAEAAELFE